jgi:multisubunit Na+/H+ antiporter MnhG subunit
MNMLIGILFVIVGFLGIFRPDFFYKSELLTPQKIGRNKRIWKWTGIALLLAGVVDLVCDFF